MLKEAGNARNTAEMRAPEQQRFDTAATLLTNLKFHYHRDAPVVLWLQQLLEVLPEIPAGPGTNTSCQGFHGQLLPPYFVHP